MWWTTDDDGGDDGRAQMDSGPLTPTFTFQTPGDLGVSYATQNGFFQRVGALVLVFADLLFTPTFTSAAGWGVIKLNAPFSSVGQIYLIAISAGGTPISYPGTRTQLLALILDATSDVLLVTQGDGAGQAAVTTSELTSGVQRSFRVTGVIRI